MHSNPLSTHFKVSNAHEKHPLKGSDEAAPKYKVGPHCKQAQEAN